MPNGGARPGAGRKPKPRRAVRKIIAEAILSEVNELQLWTNLLQATVITENGEYPDNNIRFKALSYLTNRRDGMPCQSINHSGADGGPIQTLVKVAFVTANETSG